MTEIVKQTRAKRGYIATKRKNKYGKEVPAQDHSVASAGMFSTQEMEKVMQQVAADVGASEDQIRIEAYPDGKAPIIGNPRLYTPPHMVFRGKRTQVWGGWNPGADGPGGGNLPGEGDDEHASDETV